MLIVNFTTKRAYQISDWDANIRELTPGPSRVIVSGEDISHGAVRDLLEHNIITEVNYSQCYTDVYQL